MAEKWFDELPDDAFASEEDKAYERAFATIRQGLLDGLDFDSAAAKVDVGDPELRRVIIDDMLKVLIAEAHFGKNQPLEALAEALGLPLELLQRTREIMFEEASRSAAEDFGEGAASGNA
ncbi:MAG: hypothetical protein OHK006_23040 [Thermodesulfovibrionales bacterium]